LPDASFAGQQETYWYVSGHLQLLHTCKRCFASLFTDRAISYRVDRDSEIVAPLFAERDAGGQDHDCARDS
jgi:phosphoenolpyruvate synthase/pyruvate phosphate dikinase